ncbi:hypothetical protein [Pseudomonas syringae]|uniref:hypothetical protein n=1 Tax=Pseudomonas syringae TaxID=317 RepID=UPI0004658726|nr:hypothetical protein [Pseudomonas syringae]MCH5515532.1 hypothetical protein [Pseudomonas syringae pv. syringae]MCH5626986.1 hypothetical protein [Pseudomonas syringae pv. syringae]MDY2563721.1 hypothetical protein [Pseudomonas syringae]
MGEKNKFGLGRTIPAAIRREIRRRCGFGCVRCGLAYYEYEHFDPDFKDATEHNPNGMTLLCSQCNQKRARGTLSAETVARANQNPKCKQQGFASELFDFGPEPISVRFAGQDFIDCAVIIQVKGVNLISLLPPEEEGAPIRLSGMFSDVTGATTLKIVDNEFYAGDENWDVEIVGPRIRLLRGIGDVALQIRVSPPHAIAIERINMEFEGWFLKGDEEILSFSQDGKNWNTLQGFFAEGCQVGISLG